MRPPLPGPLAAIDARLNIAYLVEEKGAMVGNFHTPIFLTNDCETRAISRSLQERNQPKLVGEPDVNRPQLSD